MPEDNEQSAAMCRVLTPQLGPESPASTIAVSLLPVAVIETWHWDPGQRQDLLARKQ